MLELTVSGDNGFQIILGIEGCFIKYKTINDNLSISNPLDSERIGIYSKDWGKEWSLEPKENFYPLIIKQSKFEQYCPGKITKIEKINPLPNS